MKKFFLFLTLITLCSCNSGLNSHGNNPQDIAGFLDLETCRPEAVEYDASRSGSGGFGPTDYHVEAVLYYDTVTFATFREKYGKETANNSNVTKRNFNYKWMPQAAKSELAASPEPYVYSGEALTQHGNPHCYLWFLNNKVLVYYFTM